MLIEIGKLPQLPQRVLPKVRTHIVRLNNLYDCLRLWVDSLYARQLFLNALHLVTLFVINDDGAWMIKRPQDFPREEIPKLIRMARERNLTELYEKSRVRVADRRVDVRVPPFLQGPHIHVFTQRLRSKRRRVDRSVFQVPNRPAAWKQSEGYAVLFVDGKPMKKADKDRRRISHELHLSMLRLSHTE